MNNQILIVDDHPAVRMTVRHVVENEGGTIVAETDTGADALRLTHQLHPDTVILDIGLPDVDGLSIIGQLIVLHAPVKIIVLTAKESNHIAIRCMRAGAHGFVNKHQDLCELVNAIHAVNGGLGYFAQRALPWSYIDLLHQEQEALFKKLSLRELDVLQQLSQGLSNEQIAERMSLSSKTIRACKARLRIKLNASLLPEPF
ncbi:MULTISPECIES: response regulator transcription factor [Pseudomonas fluorescens group]|uniref:BvgA_1 protein n=1 Tax=Pseudomonas fluorescens TaxID=294 RepID=A0A0D0TS52_PSEFL|nr:MULTISPECIES: response regulator transcription factor [Pseudomonas fluorescens group]AZE62703.1 DNA-binding response regulator, LuxR family [Pseudomonas synxantha]KIR23625.1 Virulence factors putative positive transcription regulator BvgA [Pseudomonas fluorescens]